MVPLFSGGRRRRSGVSAGFDWSALAPVALWDDRDHFQSSGGAAAGEGDPLGEWLDQSGNDYHLAQSGGARPTVKTGIQNGRSVVRFDGSGNWLAANGVATVFTGSDVPHTIIAVAKWSDLSAHRSLWSFGNSASLNNIHELRATPTPNYFWQREDGGGLAKSLTAGTPDTSFKLIRTVFTGTIGQLFVNGAQVGSDTDLDVANTTLDRFTVGALGRVAEQLLFQGDVGFMGVFHSLDAGETTDAEAFLTSYWGL